MKDATSGAKDEALLKSLEQGKIRYFKQQREDRLELLENHKYIWLKQNGVMQSLMDKEAPELLTFGYQKIIQHHIQQPLGSVLELGLGGGGFIRALQSSQQPIKYTCIELDQNVIDCFHLYFNPQAKFAEIIQGDAGKQIAQLDGQYDLLLCDLFSQYGSPPFLFQKAFYLHCKNRVKKQLVINLLPRTDKELSQTISLIFEVFGKQAKVIRIPKFVNRVLVVNL